MQFDIEERIKEYGEYLEQLEKETTMLLEQIAKAKEAVAKIKTIEDAVNYDETDYLNDGDFNYISVW